MKPLSEMSVCPYCEKWEDRCECDQGYKKLLLERDELARRLEEAEKDAKRLERVFHHGKSDGTIPPGWIEYGQWKAKIDAAMAKE
jgi:hypothetical protein